MLVKINKIADRPRRAELQDAVCIEHVTLHRYAGLIMLSISTREKWPAHNTSKGHGPGDYCEFSVHFIAEGDKRTTVTFVPESENEYALLRDGYTLHLSGRYGASYILAPSIPLDSEQELLYDGET